MRILCLLPFVPYPLNRGTNQRIYHLVQALGTRHEVTLLMMEHAPGTKMASSAPAEEALAAMQQIAHRVIPLKTDLQPWRSLGQRCLDLHPETLRHWWSPDFANTLEKLLHTESFDAIYCEDICMTQYLEKLSKHAPQLLAHLPVITDRNRVDSEYQEEQSHYIKGWRARLQHHDNHLKLKRYEKKLLQQFPYQVVCSPEDQHYLKTQLNGSCIQVVGNGFNAKTFQPQPWSTGPVPVICFTGTMDYAPNVDAMHWFFQAIYPRLQERLPAFQVKVVGLNPLPEILEYGQLPGVEVTGGVPDIVPYYAQCDVYIAPLRIGGGTRLKLLEAMAMEKPIVTTRIAAQGLSLDPEQVFFADEAEAFAHAIVRILSAPHKAQQKAQQAKKHVITHFTWQALGQQLCDFVAWCQHHHLRDCISASI